MKFFFGIFLKNINFTLLGGSMEYLEFGFSCWYQGVYCRLVGYGKKKESFLNNVRFVKDGEFNFREFIKFVLNLFVFLFVLIKDCKICLLER